jgi:hypothetical protein
MAPCPRRDPCPGVDIALVGGAPVPLPGLHHVRTRRGRGEAEVDQSERAAARPSPTAGTTVAILSQDDRLSEVADRVLWPSGREYAQFHVAALAQDGMLGVGGHKPGEYRGFSRCDPSGG